MGYRFYSSQCKHFNMTHGEFKYLERHPDSSLGKKLQAKINRKAGSPIKNVKIETKSDIIQEIFSILGHEEVVFSGLDKLTKDKLIELRKAVLIPCETIVEMPTTKTKAKYITALQTLVGKDIDFKALTLATLKDFISIYI